MYNLENHSSNLSGIARFQQHPNPTAATVPGQQKIYIKQGSLEF